ncbi:hypothetical protein SDC9_78474 [bioreactor metagenome]|uniref:ECF RNA polymerase sigma factor SigW n=1 Tax=bioreactor metagenome TaxID=1076179 RepID=A0A644YUC8_9ZZZZ|nr:sigma-70 family RNA polymerase sigma factor [Candidatus Metalachnospira sp.]
MIFFVITISENNKELICTLFKDNNKFFYYIANNILHNQHNSEDVLQDTFVKISENIEKINAMNPSQQISFCVVIVKNLSLNKLRNEKHTVTSEDSNLLNEYSISCSDTIDEKIIEMENVCEIKKLMELLPESDRALLNLKWGMKMNYKEVANILNISEDSAKKRGQRILKKVKKMYEEGKC